VQPAGQLFPLEIGKARPESDERRARHLRLKAGQTLNRLDGSQLLASEQKLPGEQRAIERTLTHDSRCGAGHR
jgi:hypothetical protein